MELIREIICHEFKMRKCTMKRVQRRKEKHIMHNWELAQGMKKNSLMSETMEDLGEAEKTWWHEQRISYPEGHGKCTAQMKIHGVGSIIADQQESKLSNWNKREWNPTGKRLSKTLDHGWKESNLEPMGCIAVMSIVKIWRWQKQNNDEEARICGRYLSFVCA